MTDQIKLVAAIVLVVAGIVGYYVFADSATALRVLFVLAGGAAGVGVAWPTALGQRFYGFSQESIKEARKVVWPTRKETMQTTGVVFAFVVVMAILLWVVDASLLWVVRWLMGRGDS
ncbi:MAG: preprotein translocase subunit SecE [Betaproteobacteria bacterium]|nr:preprotein translocase subunit SecE [Betaproteobacteria bacterium]